MIKMNKIFDWLLCKDIKKENESSKKELSGFIPLGKPQNLEKGIKMLIDKMIDLDYSTSKYSRILVILTIIIAILTVLMIVIMVFHF